MASPCGLLNLGNTCYLNATLQAMGHVPTFARFILQHAPSDGDGCGDGCGDGAKRQEREECVAVYTAVRRVLAMCWAHAGQSGAVSPTELVAALRPRLARHGITNVREQSDAHELYCILVDALCGGAPADMRREFEALLSGSTQQLVRCETCGATSTQVVAFTALDLDIGSGADSASMLRAAFAPERISEWTCDSCLRGRSAARITRLWSMPPLLVLAVKRAFGSGSWDVSRSAVEPSECIPRSLIARLAAPGSPAAAAADKTGERGRYRLAGMVCHVGNQGGGHYTAFVRHPSAQASGSERWREYDDDTVRNEGELPAHARSSCYMLFYALHPRR